MGHGEKRLAHITWFNSISGEKKGRDSGEIDFCSISNVTCRNWIEILLHVNRDLTQAGRQRDDGGY